MESHSDEKTTSRRSFAKSIAALLAIVLLASTLVNGQGRRRPTENAGGKVNPSSSGGAQRTTKDKRTNEHDTPPPLLIMEGSCVVEIDADANDLGTPGTTGGRKKYRVRPEGLSGNIYLAHIKIVDGSGEMLYRFDNFRKHSVEVALALSDGEVMNLSAVGDRFEVEVKGNKKVALKAGDPPMNSKRARFRYMNDPGTDEHRIQAIKVTKGGSPLYNVEFSDLKSAGVELKVMIWWEER